MSKIGGSRKLVILFLMLLLLAPWQLGATERPAAKAKNGLTTQLVQFWHLLFQVWMGKAGADIEPWGVIEPNSPGPSNAGSEIDPWGNHGTAGATDAGCGMDPWGRSVC